MTDDTERRKAARDIAEQWAYECISIFYETIEPENDYKEEIEIAENGFIAGVRFERERILKIMQDLIKESSKGVSEDGPEDLAGEIFGMVRLHKELKQKLEGE